MVGRVCALLSLDHRAVEQHPRVRGFGQARRTDGLPGHPLKCKRIVPRPLHFSRAGIMQCCRRAQTRNPGRHEARNRQASLGMYRDAGDQRPGTRQQVREERNVAAAPELFCAEQTPPEKYTNGICHVEDWQFVAVCV